LTTKDASPHAAYELANQPAARAWADATVESDDGVGACPLPEWAWLKKGWADRPARSIGRHVINPAMIAASLALARAPKLQPGKKFPEPVEEIRQPIPLLCTWWPKAS
jgi:hypothetical protein